MQFKITKRSGPTTTLLTCVHLFTIQHVTEQSVTFWTLWLITILHKHDKMAEMARTVCTAQLYKSLIVLIYDKSSSLFFLLAARAFVFVVAVRVVVPGHLLVRLLQLLQLFCKLRLLRVGHDFGLATDHAFTHQQTTVVNRTYMLVSSTHISSYTPNSSCTFICSFVSGFLCPPICILMDLTIKHTQLCS